MKKLLEDIKSKFKTNKQVAFIIKPVFFVTLMVYSGYIIYTFGHRRPLDLIIALVVTILGLLLASFAGIFLMDFIKKLPSATIFYLGSVIAMLYIMFDSNRAERSNILAILVIPLFFMSLGYLIYRLVYKHKHWIVWPVRVIFILSSSLLVMMFFWNGLEPSYENAYLSLQTDFAIGEMKPIYQVDEGIYGNEDYLEKYDIKGRVSETTSIAYFLSKWNKAREKQVGFNVYNVPLNGMYYMPDEVGQYPLVLIVHGNHEMTHDSEDGYGYLGRYLAERGYIVVSVDENFLNFSTYDSELLGHSLGSENDARAYVLLEHLDYLLKESNNDTSPFYNRIDSDQIALIGHSRGGEAVAIARYFNELNYLPNNSNKTFDEDFEIKSIVSIAPTDSQYKPAGRKVELKDVNYLLLQGMHDMDVSYMAGINQYERISYEETDRFKSAVSIYGANHGYFNQSWLRSDNSSLGGLLHNSAQLLEREVQEEIASRLVYNFLEATLKENKDYRQGFMNLKVFDGLPETLYQSIYYDGSCVDLVNYNEDHYIETGLNHSRISANLSKWSEGAMKLDGKSSDVYGAYLGYSSSGQYNIELKEPLKVSADDYLYLTLADASEDNDELLNLWLEIEDTYGHIHQVSLDKFSKIQHKIDINLAKLFFIEDVNNHELILQTHQIPIKWFIEDDRSIDIKKVSLIFKDGHDNKLFLKELGIRFHD
ncbi:hypothetical protein EZV73_04450 [Acidaminobacter sp. JC074]|uniref:hypothetical protein n=1 Tax=Acidaminobacter sp. JC074 TaxID=2530199 RepID=UPI001F112D65|nr:hypothetical protein [Acidaminobacter sp. JC074]MCH4886804.1 hypothetical protein [Acidaminobacter sp. JC074]